MRPRDDEQTILETKPPQKHEESTKEVVENESAEEEDFEKGSEEIRLLGLIAVDPKPRHRIGLLRPTGKTCKLTAKTLGFVKAKISTDVDGLWMVSTTGSTRKVKNGSLPIVF